VLPEPQRGLQRRQRVLREVFGIAAMGDDLREPGTVERWNRRASGRLGRL